jgi:hypothetical protein
MEEQDETICQAEQNMTPDEIKLVHNRERLMRQNRTHSLDRANPEPDDEDDNESLDAGLCSMEENKNITETPRMSPLNMSMPLSNHRNRLRSLGGELPGWKKSKTRMAIKVINVVQILILKMREPLDLSPFRPNGQ